MRRPSQSSKKKKSEPTMIWSILAFFLRMTRQYILRCESLLSIIFVYLFWAYVRWLTTSSAKGNGYLFGPRAKDLDAKIVEYVTTPPSTSPVLETMGLMQIKPDPTESMEDRMSIFWDTGQEPQASIQAFAIFDGHGGQAVASYLESVFVKQLIEKVRAEEERLALAEDSSRVNIAQITHSLIQSTDDKIVSGAQGLAEIVGSTLVSAVLYGERWLTVANVGDSRAVYSDSKGKAFNLTKDHKPSAPEEKKRIEAAGGTVEFFGVWRVNGILAMSRTMGDGSLKRLKVVNADADVATFDLSKRNWEFLIIASDGLWDVVTPQEAVDAVNTALEEGDETRATQSLTDIAINRLWVKETLVGLSMDNVSVMVIQLPKSDTREV